MEISCKGWNPSMQETMCLDRWVVLECYKEPFDATDHAIDSVITTLKVEGCNPDIKTTITLPLDEYRLLISDAQKKAKEEGCKEGREEAWDLARRIGTWGDDCYTHDEVRDLFERRTFGQILRMPVEEVLARDREYQKEKKTLHVGDEVEFVAPGRTKFKELHKGYVIGIDKEIPRWVYILTKDGSYHRSPVMCEKTGKHNPDIEKVMASFEVGESE